MTFLSTISFVMTISIALLGLMRQGHKRISPYERGLIPVILLALMLSFSFSMIQLQKGAQFYSLYIVWKQAIMILTVFLGLIFIYFVHKVIWLEKKEKLFWSILFAFSGVVFVKFYLLLQGTYQKKIYLEGFFLPMPSIPYFVFYVSLFLILMLRLFSFSKKIRNPRRKVFVTNMLVSIVLLLSYFTLLIISREKHAFYIHIMFTLWFAHLILFEMKYLKDEILWDVYILLQHLLMFVFVVAFLFVMNLVFPFCVGGTFAIKRSFVGSIIFAPVVFFSILLFKELVKNWDKSLFSKLHYFKEHSKMTAIYAQSIFDIKTFHKFIETLFEDFPSFQKVHIFSSDHNGELITITKGKEKVIPASEKNRKVIKKLFSDSYSTFETVYALTDKEDILFKNIFTNKSKHSYFFPLKSEENKNVGFILYTKRALSRKEIYTIIDVKYNMLLALNNVFVFEKEREKVLAEIMEKEKAERLNVLQEQNDKLNKAYSEIKDVQKELIKKERKASIVQITLSLDSEISNPLTNILLPLQFLLSKLKSKESIESARLESILEILEKESAKIKDILEKLRNFIDKWGKKALLEEDVMKGIESDFSSLTNESAEEV